MNAIKKLIVYLLLIAIALFMTFPFFWLVSTSLKGQTETIFPSTLRWIPEAPTLENYKIVLEHVDMIRSTINTTIITILGIFLNALLAAMAAYPLARINFVGKKVIFALLMGTLMIPMQGTMIINYVTLKKLGMLDTFLGLVLPTAVNVIAILILKNAYEAVPDEIEEAARVDGCGEFRLWIKMMVPNIKPALAAVCILGFVYYWNDFMWPLIVISSDEKWPLQMALSKLSSAVQTNYRYITAGAVMSMLPILLFFAFTQRYFIEGTKGAVKG